MRKGWKMKLKDFDFRIWDSNTNKFIELNISDNIRALPRSSDDLVLEIWTGYTDTKDARIYENDIIKVDEKTFSVSGYGGEVTAWILLESDGTPCCSLAEVMFESGRVEVIGNIHEKKELLKDWNEKNVWTRKGKSINFKRN